MKVGRSPIICQKSSYKKTTFESALEIVDDYFNCGKNRFRVITLADGKSNGILLEPNLSKTNPSVIVRIIKIFSYFTVVIPLTMLIVKCILRATLHFTLIDPETELKQGIGISQEILDKITKLGSKILNAENDPSIDWLARNNNSIFKLKDHPELVFKFSREPLNDKSNKKIDERFENMVKAKEVCLRYGLKYLTIPPAVKQVVMCDGKPHHFIVEKYLNINPDEEIQKDEVV